MKTSRADAPPGRLGAASWAALVAAVAAAPYFAARAAAPEGSRYLWNLPPYGSDSQAYLAWERQAELGHFLFKLKYTGLPHAPFVFQPFFLLVGRIAACGGWDLGIVQLVFKTAGVLLFWAAFRRLARRLSLESGAFWAAALLAGLGTGLGWMFPRADSADLWLIDVNTLWSLTWNPLFPFCLALLVFFVESIDRARAPGDSRGAWAAGLAAALLLLLHPYAAPLLLLFALWAARTAGPGTLARIAFPVFPVGVYLAWAVVGHPILSLHDRAGVMVSPSWLGLLVGVAPPLALALGGWLSEGGGFVRRHAPLFVWAAGALLLCRLPFWFQRKILFGVHVPLCLLGGAGAAELARRFRGAGASALVWAGVAVAVSLPTWGRIAADGRRVLSSEEGADYYVRRPLAEALRFLRGQGTPDDVVLSTPETGGLVPILSDKTAMWGHWAQGVDSDGIRLWIGKLMIPGDPDAKTRKFWGKVNYVLADGELKQLIDAGGLSWIKSEGTLLFARDGVDVYGPPVR